MMNPKVAIIVECGLVVNAVLSPTLKNVEVIVWDYDVVDENAPTVVRDPSGDLCGLYPVAKLGVLTKEEEKFIDQALER